METLLAPLFDATLEILRSGGVWAIFVLMILESACIPVPSELTMLFGGYLVSRGDASMLAVVSAGVIGNLVGSVLTWYAGAYGGRALVDRHGKWVRLNHHHLDVAHRWFERWGTATVFFTRVLPIVRTFISLPAGIARMPLGRFTLFTFLGCVPWVWALAAIGNSLGDDWEHAREVLHKFDYVVALAVVALVVWAVVRVRRSRRGQAV